MLLFPGSISAQKVTGIWQKESSSGFTPRYSITSSAVNGEIYVMGGIKGDNVLNTMEVYDPAANSWSTPVTTGTFTPRYGLTSSVVDNKIYVIGGYDDTCMSTVEVFDPSTNEWSTPVTTGVFTPRAHLTSNTVNGKIYAMGGVQYDSLQNKVFLSTVEVFDPQTNSWSTPVTTGSLTARSSHVSVVVGGKIYIIAGEGPGAKTVDVFDPASNHWSSPAATITERTASTANVLDNKIFVMGGYVGIDVNLVEVFDPSSNSWDIPDASGTFTAREGIASSVVGKSIYVLGGLSEGGFLNTNEVFTLSAAGVAEAPESQIVLFPNPSNGSVQVRKLPNDLVSIIVFNIFGEPVITLGSPRSKSETLDLSKFPAGIYYAKFVTTNSIEVRKIIRE